VDPAALLIAVRFALYLDLMLVFGLPLFWLYSLRGAEQRAGFNVISSAGAAAVSLSGIALSAFGLLLLAAAMSDVPIAQLDRETLNALLDGTAIGTAGKIRVVALLAALPVSCWPRAKPRVRWAAQAGLGAVALGSLAWTGHGAADEGAAGWAHVTADIVHLFAAGAWIGALAGLLMLFVRARAGREDRLERTALAHRALVGFGTVGTICVALIVLTGLVNSWFLVGLENLPSLAGSLYGRLLILKLLLFAGMLGLAGWNRFQLTPAIGTSLGRGDDAPSMRSIRRSVAFETSLAIAVLVLVAWIGTLAPPTAG
jgi:putative copper resistance protein D